MTRKGIMRASRVSLHGRKRGWRQQLAADVLDELAILLRLGDHRDPFGIGKKSAPALLALGHAVPGEHVGDLLAALADQRGPKPGLADVVLLPDPQRSRSRTATAAPACAPARSGRSAIRRSWPFTSSRVDGY